MKVRIRVRRFRRRETGVIPTLPAGLEAVVRERQDAESLSFLIPEAPAVADDFEGSLGLREGDQIQCPRCSRFHRVSHSLASTGPLAPLFYFCGDRTYQAGRRGEASMYPVRRAPR